MKRPHEDSDSEPDLPEGLDAAAAAVKVPGKKKKSKKKKKKAAKERLPETISKRRLEDHTAMEEKTTQPEQPDPGRQWTVSVALPGSFIANCQSFELRTYVAGEVARALTLFNVDEVVVFEEGNVGDTAGIAGMKTDPSAFLARILQYQDCPPYLRQQLFPRHHDLKFAGLLNPTAGPHHLRREDVAPYREGVVLQRPVKPNKGSFVNVGLYKEAQIDHKLEAGTRVTVELDEAQMCLPKIKVYQGKAVAPSAPRTEKGMYWGYNVRLADSLSKVFTQCPFEGGYDCTVGIDAEGEPVENSSLPRFNHILIVFGGVYGIKTSLESDETLAVSKPADVFDVFVDTCPAPGSRSIRTEESLLVSLAALRPHIAQQAGKQ